MSILYLAQHLLLKLPWQSTIIPYDSSIFFREQTIELKEDNRRTRYPYVLKVFDDPFYLLEFLQLFGIVSDLLSWCVCLE